jgi:diacylglycerol kinase (ATP)
MLARVGQLSPEQNRVVISLNPIAGARDRHAVVDEFVSSLTARGLQVELLTDLDRVTQHAEWLHRCGKLRALVAAGGDGTLAELVNRTTAGLPMAVLPLGTENLLGKYLRLAGRADLACRTIVEGSLLEMDACRVTRLGRGGEVPHCNGHEAIPPATLDAPQNGGHAARALSRGPLPAARCSQADDACGRLFLLQLSCGVDAEVIHAVDNRRTGHVHHLTYARPILDSFTNYSYPELRVYKEDGDDPWTPASGSSNTCGPSNACGTGEPFATQEPTLRARWVGAFNLPCYALRLGFVRNADATDGLMNVCSFRGGGLWNTLRYLLSVAARCHRRMEDFQVFTARRLRIESDPPAPYQIDGDTGGVLPVRIELVPRRWTLVVPRTYLRRHGVAELPRSAQQTTMQG